MPPNLAYHVGDDVTGVDVNRDQRGDVVPMETRNLGSHQGCQLVQSSEVHFFKNF